MAVPLLDLNRQNLPLEQELNAAFRRVLQSGQFILGPDSVAFENEIAQLIGVKHALAISSGTDAILLALMALGIGPGDEVICPAFTFFATAGCVARVGAIPVFCDSDPLSFNLDPKDAERKITSRTKAIIPVHLYGQPAEMEKVLEFAKESEITVIEDAAQALGATYEGRPVGTMGTLGAFSFFPTKNLGAFGDGGLLITNNDAIAERAKILRVHGAQPKYHHRFVGANFRMDTLQCALLRVKLRHYEGYNARRRSNAAYYSERLSPLEAEGRLILPKALPNRDHIWNQYTLRVQKKDQRDALKDHLTSAGIGSEIYYPIPLHRQKCFAETGTRRVDALTVAEKLASEALSIPIFPELRSEEMDEVIAAIISFFKT
jgi:dTDP-4-amino-4,6-dideoxygalactose transaminase